MFARVIIASFLISIISQGGLIAQWTDQQKMELSGDKIIIENVEDASGLPGVRVIFEITGNQSEIWKMHNDFENFHEIYQGVDSLRIIKEDTQSVTIEFWGDAVIKKLNYILKRDYIVPERKLTWHRLSGDLKRIEGGWEIFDSDTPNRKILVYETYIQYGGIVPDKLIRNGAKRKAKKMGETLRIWLRENRQLYN